MSEKKHTGFAALYELDRERESRKPPKDQDGSIPNTAASRNIKISGYPQEKVASKLATDQPLVASLLATELNSAASHNIKSKKDRHLKSQLNVRLDANLLMEIRVYCVQAGIEAQEFISLAASHYLQTHVASKLAHDDMMIYKTHDDIIMAYERLSIQKWTRRDDREGQKYNGTDIRLIEMALILTIERKLRGNTSKQPIKSFSYFTQEIDLILEQKRTGELPSAIDEYYRYVMSSWEKRIRPLRDEKWRKGNL